MVTHRMKYIIANWKANKNIIELKEWCKIFVKNIVENKSLLKGLQENKFKIIVCPPATLLYPLQQLIQKFPNIEVGSQDISIFEKGTFTGEITANSLKNICKYTIIGHSERKKNNYENDQTDRLKLANAFQNQLIPIYCISSSTTHIPPHPALIVYEPPEAISLGDGKGQNVSIAQILQFKKMIQIPLTSFYIYGGSVNEKNASDYLHSKEIDGILIGGASLDPMRFYEIISCL